MWHCLLLLGGLIDKPDHLTVMVMPLKLWMEKVSEMLGLRLFVVQECICCCYT